MVDDYLTVTDAIQDDIDEVETEVFSPHGSQTADVGRIYQLKRELLEMKRAVVPLARPLEILSTKPLRSVDPEIRAYFRDVADHLARVTEQITGFASLLDSTLPGPRSWPYPRWCASCTA